MTHSSFGKYLLAGTLLLAATPLRADLVGVNFSGASSEQSSQSLGASDSAGFFAQKFWNNAPGLTGSVGLEADGGTSMSVYYSGFTAQWQASANGSTQAGAVLPNAKLMKGSLLATQTQPVLVQVSGIPLPFTSGGYALVVYADAPANNTDVVIKATLQLSSGIRTYYLRDAASQNFSGTFVRGHLNSSADAGAQTPKGNFFVLTGLSERDLALAIEPGESNLGATAAINAVQVVPNSLVQTLAPRIISSLTASATYKQAFTYQVQTDFPAATFTATGLPPGLAISTTTGLISGSSTQTGTYQVAITAANAVGSTSETLTLTVSGQTPARLTSWWVPGIRVEGGAGQTYLIEYSDDLGDPINWKISGTVKLATSIQYYLDPEFASRPNRFYRATLQP